MDVISTHGTEVMCAVKFHDGSGLTLRIESGGVCGFEEFSIDYPQWIQYNLAANGFEPGMKRVPTLDPIGTSEVQMLPWSRPERQLPKPYPNAVTTYLFLGNAEVAGNLSKLQEKNITFVLNLTPNIPNYFEGEGLQYLRIPHRLCYPESDTSHPRGQQLHCSSTVQCSQSVINFFTPSTAKSFSLDITGN
ncbi:hypothetical protein CEXT_671451 [Caerostris extrusa]|uniref:Uncharacterized protein n=1 Tax=Caerostris extrusa TaxID=172846 RepID=A0AAV4NDF0_CAEEX|nr:hypothetical protein CEXT_671451 [Caerostris extrusa]